MRRLAIVVPFLLGCRLDVYGQGPAEDSSSSGDSATSTGVSPTSTGDSTTAVASGTGTTAAVGSSSSSGSEGSSSTTGTVLACGESLDPPGGGCDDICSQCDASGTCRFDCTGTNVCVGDMYICPEGRPCEVECSGPSSCRDVEIACPADYECNVECTGEDACAGVVIVCDSGPCTLTCNTNNRSCTSTQLHCSDTNVGTITCNQGQQEPKPEAVPHPDAMCGCEVSGAC